MTFLVFFFLINVVNCANLDLLKLVLKENTKEIYNLTDVRKLVRESIGDLKKVDLSNYQKKVIWEIFKSQRSIQDLTANDIKSVNEFLDVIPEHDLSQFNISDWNIVEILGQVDTFSRSQASVIANALKAEWGRKILTEGHYINKICSLICGFSEDELSKITRQEFKKIKSAVFSNLKACSDSQLQILHDLVIRTYGRPQSWSKKLINHIGMIILSLNINEIRSIRPSELQDLPFEMIENLKPKLLDAFTPQQIQNLKFQRSKSDNLQIDRNTILLALYLVLKY